MFAWAHALYFGSQCNSKYWYITYRVGQTEEQNDCTPAGEKRFKLDFPWDGAKTLQLRSNNSAMKEAWVSLLRATLQEAESQIKSTGSVFAYGGEYKHLCGVVLVLLLFCSCSVRVIDS